MKYTIVKKIRDKYTKAVYRAGDVVEFTDERATELNAVAHGPYAIPIEFPEQESDKPEQESTDVPAVKAVYRAGDVVEFTDERATELNAVAHGPYAIPIEFPEQESDKPEQESTDVPAVKSAKKKGS
ncbi:MAG: hypothetical protein QM689_12710 [Oscillospiraceae bacterium]